MAASQGPFEISVLHNAAFGWPGVAAPIYASQP